MTDQIESSIPRSRRRRLAAYTKGYEAGLAAGSSVFGPYAHLNGNRTLSEDEWTVDSDPDANDDERFSLPLYSLVEPPFLAKPTKQEGGE